MSDFPAPIDVLPHRAPFLFIDSISQLEIGVSATGHWKLTGDEWFFPGHFPGRPTLPGVLMCEAIAQLGAYALLSDPLRINRVCHCLEGLMQHVSVGRFRLVMNWFSKPRWDTSVLVGAKALVGRC